MRLPNPGDLWHRDDAFMIVTAIYERDGELVGAEVQHSDDRDGVTSDVLWPDGFDGWQPGVCRATALADRPPAPERDERSEVERLREEVERLRKHVKIAVRESLKTIPRADVVRALRETLAADDGTWAPATLLAAVRQRLGIKWHELEDDDELRNARKGG